MPLGKYRRWYDELMAKARSRLPVSGVYYERHHVTPVCLGGLQDTVLLTYREHFIAHWLLTKFTAGKDRQKMCWALFKMGSRRLNCVRVAPWQLALARESGQKNRIGASQPRLSAFNTETKKGKPNFGVSKARMGKPTNKGRPMSTETRLKMSLARKGKPQSSAPSLKFQIQRAIRAGRKDVEAVLCH